MRHHPSRPIRLAFLAVLLLAGPAISSELRGHGGPVRALSVAADGDAVITGSFDSTAILWSLRTGSARQVLQFHNGQVTAVAAFPDGRFATAGEDGRIALWTAGSDNPAAVLEGHTGPVAALAVSPDGSFLASASWDTTVRRWPLSGGAPVVLEKHRGNVNAVAFLPDGRLASGGYDNLLVVWPARTGSEPITVVSPSPINALVGLPDGRLAAGCADGRVRVFTSDGAEERDVEVGRGPVIALAASNDGAHLAAAGVDGAVAVLGSSDLALRHKLVGPGLPVWSLAFTTDGATLLTGGTDRVVRRWSVKTGEHLGAIVASRGDPLAAPEGFDGDRGAEVFRACAACHTLTADGGPRAGPTLHRLFGRKIASVPGYRYSEAFRSMDIVWTPETVKKLFEVGPHAFTPGTRMPEQTIGSAADREALVRFLEKATQ